MTNTNESKWRELEPAIVYTFEEIIDAQKYPKAYGRKFVVVEKYDELRTQLAAAKEELGRMNAAYMAAVSMANLGHLKRQDEITKLTEEVQRLKDEIEILRSKESQYESTVLATVAERDRLAKELESVVKIGVEGQREINRKLSAENKNLNEKLKLAKEALKFNISKHNEWIDKGHWCDSKRVLQSVVDSSKSALAKLEDGNE